MNFQEVYQEKTQSAAQAVSAHIQNGDSIFIGGLTTATETITQVLESARHGQLNGIALYGNMLLGDLDFTTTPFPEDVLRYHCFFGGQLEREGAKSGNVVFVPLHFRSFGRYMEHIQPDVAILPMTPPDGKGYCNLGPLGFNPAGARTAKKIIAQITPDLPRVYGSQHNFHVSGIAAFVSGNDPAAELTSRPPSPEEEKIALSIDLTGQVCAESIGFRQYSGSGGQMDYIRGATLSKGGKSFIAVSSVAQTKDGPKSRIVLTLEAGSVVTSLRAEVQYIVTEYGCVNLQYCDIPTRAKRLISIAHPDFREELAYQAKKNGYIY